MVSSGWMSIWGCVFGILLLMLIYLIGIGDVIWVDYIGFCLVVSGFKDRN